MYSSSQRLTLTISFFVYHDLLFFCVHPQASQWSVTFIFREMSSLLISPFYCKSAHRGALIAFMPSVEINVYLMGITCTYVFCIFSNSCNVLLYLETTTNVNLMLIYSYTTCCEFTRAVTFKSWASYFKVAMTGMFPCRSPDVFICNILLMHVLQQLKSSVFCLPSVHEKNKLKQI